MSTLISSLAIPPFYVSSGITESSKLIANNHHTFGNKINQRSGKMDSERNLFIGETMQSFSRSAYCNIDKVYARSTGSVEQVEQRFSFCSEVGELKKGSTYLFRTEFGDLVNVFVRKTNVNYSVYIEISSMTLGKNNDRVALCWGIFRSDSSCLKSPESESTVRDENIGTIETPFLKTSIDQLAVELGFEAKQIPFYLSFVLKMDSDSSGSEIRSHRKTNFCVPIGFGSGSPDPLGLSFSSDGSMKFSIFSRTAEKVVLCLYDDSTMENPALELDLDPYINRTGDIWHASFESAWNFVSYGYRVKGSPTRSKKDNFDAGGIILDPYAKIIWNSTNHHGNGLTKCLGQLCKEPSFDWGTNAHPNLPLENLVVYRLNVKHFTEHKSSQLPTDVAGTFTGLIEKLQHFKDLGVNAVLLEPILPFDEQVGPYFPCHFFSPMNLYGPSGGSISSINSMKEMVKKFHENGIEVLMEVIFTHTHKIGALQGIDGASYYFVNRNAGLEARHALNCNYPIVQQMILDSLRHWVTEFHIDGFCFINASSLMRGFHGEFLSRPPLVEAIAIDPHLSKTKIIADFWDPHDLDRKEIRFPHWKRWGEVNTKFCSDVRNFLRGKGQLSNLATRLCGSGDIFSDGRGPAFSFNFIARNFGLSLVDLVSFSGGELASELSWNCGEEGPTNKTVVLEKRLKQIRNFLFVLYVSLGIPVLNMGDECGRSSNGSLTYSERKPLDWNALKASFGIQITKFIFFLSSFRKRRSDLLQRRNFLKEENIDWFGSDQSPPRWDDPFCKFIAMMLKADKEETKTVPERSERSGDIFIAFNASDHSESVILPVRLEGMAWHRLVDTALSYPGFLSSDGEPVPEQMVGLVAYEMKSHSCALFESRRSTG